jgi:hypothetical protein
MARLYREVMAEEPRRQTGGAGLAAVAEPSR